MDDNLDRYTETNDAAQRQQLARDNGLPRADIANRAKTHSVVEQMLGAAETIKAIHQDLDVLQADFAKRIDALRKRMGGRA